MVEHLSLLPEGDQRPLFPAQGGVPTTKSGWADTFQALATALGLRTAHPNGARAFTGHSARATGAVHLASTQVELWRIQLFGRWGSEVFLHYIQDAPLAHLDRLAVESSVQTSIRSARQELQALLARTSSGGHLREALAVPTAAMAQDCEAATPLPGAHSDAAPASWIRGPSPVHAPITASSRRLPPITFAAAVSPAPNTPSAQTPPPLPHRAQAQGGGKCFDVEGLQVGR